MLCDFLSVNFYKFRLNRCVFFFLTFVLFYNIITCTAERIGLNVFFFLFFFFCFFLGFFFCFNLGVCICRFVGFNVSLKFLNSYMFDFHFEYLSIHEHSLFDRLVKLI